MQKHAPSDDVHLVVYRASAGSGKTHRLTGEYLKLLLSSPFAYRHILAVTFTNKATDEMKSRIIAELAKLATNQKSNYVDELCNTFSKNEDKLRLEARDTLVRILHDYSAFSVSTIDKFFQQTMRAFTRELGLGGGYNVELDTQKVLGEAIDSMLYDLEKSENKQLLDWLIRFSEEKVESGETWNIRSDIQTLSTEIFKESYKAFSDEIQADIANKDLLENYKNQLKTFIDAYEKRSQEIARKAVNTMERFDLKAEDFKGGTRSTFFSFHKWNNKEIKEPTNTFLALADNLPAWYTSKTEASIKARIDEAFVGGLNECVVQIIAHYQDSRFYQTAYEINRYYFTLGILSDVDKKIREYAAEKNLMLISDTTELLNKIIKGDDTPFIYEKIGTRVDHYMIDEFQDTSGMQWANFLPLLKNSLSAGNKNLIVGDVKQSIYRWRNSDWNLLDEQLDIDFRTEGINHQSLDTNWRSLRNVIDFNNTIFGMSALALQQVFNASLPEEVTDTRVIALQSKIERAYAGSYQQIPETRKGDLGCVTINFVDKEQCDDWYTYVLEQLPQTIESLQEKGYSLKDIAILVRTKKEGADIANALLEYKREHPHSVYKYDIISDEALYVGNARSIKLIISLMKYLRNPADTSLRALAIYEYYKFKDQLTAEDALQKHFSIDNEFPQQIAGELNRISELPLYEMAEEIFDLFHEAMEEDENIYIQSFLDMILDFTVRNSSDLNAYLSWWDETGVKKTIFTPDGQNAIRIMTIHKSKGLGFNVVLVPFCNWELDHKLSTILWCQPAVEPFNQLHLVPVKYSQRLKNTIFEYEYYDEKMRAFIDNLNLLYVAFTRAERELIAFAPKPKPKDDITNISSLLWFCANNALPHEGEHELLNLASLMDEETSSLHIGEDNKVSIDVRKQSTADELQMGALASIPFENRLKLKLNNKYYFSENGSREYGTMMHEVISKVNSVHDLDKAVGDYYIAGDITSTEKEEVLNLLRNYLSNPDIEQWYTGEYKVLNEVQILQPKGSFIRPDRVMIKGDEVIVVDYKFGEKEDKKYLKQVKQYVNEILKMGYTKVSGYICYVTLSKLVKLE